MHLRLNAPSVISKGHYSSLLEKKKLDFSKTFTIVLIQGIDFKIYSSTHFATTEYQIKCSKFAVKDNVFGHVKFYSTNLYKKAGGSRFNKAKMDYSRKILMRLEEISKQDTEHLIEQLLG